MFLDRFEIEKTNKGTFIYKSKGIPFKKNIKPSYKDKPHFPVVESIETEMKKKGRLMIQSIIKQTLKQIEQIV